MATALNRRYSLTLLGQFFSCLTLKVLVKALCLAISVTAFRRFVQYLTIYDNKTLPQRIKICQSKLNILSNTPLNNFIISNKTLIFARLAKCFKIWSHRSKWAIPPSPASFFKQTLQFLQQKFVKNVHSIYGIGIWNHNLLNVSPPMTTRLWLQCCCIPPSPATDPCRIKVGH